MDKRDKGWMFAFALAAGFVGGFVSNRLFPIRRTFTAQEYQVVDKQGKVRARLGMIDGKPAPGFGATRQVPGLRLYDRDGSVQMALFLHAPNYLNFAQTNGNMLWCEEKS